MSANASERAGTRIDWGTAETRSNLLSTTMLLLSALREGFQAARQYEALTARGVAPAVAVRAVLASFEPGGPND